MPTEAATSLRRAVQARARRLHAARAIWRLLLAYERREITRGQLRRLWRAVLQEGYGR